MQAKDWRDITPRTLISAVEHIRKMFDEGAWKCSWVTQNLCFAALHPEGKQTDIDSYESAFVQYRTIIGSAVAGEFDRQIQIGTPPAIFYAYLQAMDAGLRTEIRRLFADLLNIAATHSAKLDEHPADWAESHLSMLINSKKHVVATWIKSVCDKQDLSKPFNTPQETEDFIFWKDWRAPKLIYMQPSGNLRYDPITAWDREDEKKTGELLDALSGRFIEFLGFDLEKLVGDAHVALAKVNLIAKESAVDKNADDDRHFAQIAIEEARKSVPEDERAHPKVGAVVVKDGKILSQAHRGEKSKSHAEYVALDDKLSDDLVAGATVYTTLEPCTTRKHPKIPCAQRLIDRRVQRVVIGMLDPNPDIRGRGDQLLSDAGIEVQLFPRELRAQVEEMNREFIRAQKQRQNISPTDASKDESDPSEYLEQRKGLPETDLGKEIWSKPYWRIWVRPTEFRPARFQSLEQCRQFVLSSEIGIRGWMAYPSFSPNKIELGDEWVACETEHSSFSLHWLERWTLFRSGQFVDNRTIDEIPQLGDRIHVLEILDKVTAVFEFAARMSDRGLLSPRAAITLELHGVAGRGLTWPQDQIGDIDAVERNGWCQEESVISERRISSEELRPRARQLARDVALEIFGKFNWKEPPVEKLKLFQDSRFGNVD